MKARTPGRAPLCVSARMARRLPSLAEKLGVDASELCARHQLDRGLLEDPAARLPLQNLLSGFEDLLHVTQHSSLGLELSRHAEPGTYHTPALVLLASNTLREGFARAFEFQRLWGDGQRFAVHEPPALGRSEAGLAVTFRIPSPRREGHGILEVCAIAETLTAARALTGRPQDAALSVGFPSTTDSVSELTNFFGVAPELGPDVAFVVLSNEMVDARLVHANALFLSVFERQARDELSQMPPEADMAANVRGEIVRGLARGRFALADCAEALGTSTRTLERRLAEHGTSYQELVEAVRRELALRLLKDTRGIEEVALLLGYTERSSFHRACLRWFGKTPLELRRV